MLNLFELWVGLAGVISGIVFFYAPAAITHDALTHIIGHEWSVMWNVSYFLSGLMIWFGLLRPSPRLEIAGLFLLGGASSVNGIAISSVFGLRGTATAATLISLGVASWLRASFVWFAVMKLVENEVVSSD